MSANTSVGHPRFKAWEPLDVNPEDSSSPHPEFVIEIFALFSWAEENHGHPIESFAAAETSFRSFRVPRQHIVQESTSWSTVSSMLSEMNVQLQDHPFLIERILQKARCINGESRNVNRKTIMMLVYITGLRRSQEWRPQQSTREAVAQPSVEELKTVEVFEGSVVPCVVCLEELALGSRAASLPCSHLYHKDCIVNWLRMRRVCPLCRFQLPS